MAMENGRPQKPSDINLGKFLRFVDPADPDKIIEIKITKVAGLTPDGKERYVIETTSTLIGLLNNTDVFPPLNTLNPISSTLPVSVHASISGFLDERYNWTIAPSGLYVLLVPTISFKRITGFFKHTISNGKLEFREASHYLTISDTAYFIDPNNDITLNTALAPTVPIDVELKAEYVLIVVKNNDVATKSLSLVLETKVN